MKKLEWSTQKIKVTDLLELEYNPRKISEEKKKKLIASLEKFNLVEIPAVNTDMKIIGGNQRVKALIIAGRGDELIDVRVPNRKLTEKEVKEYCIISNTHAGEFDFDILDLEFNDIDFSEIGFDMPEFKMNDEKINLDFVGDEMLGNNDKMRKPDRMTTGEGVKVYVGNFALYLKEDHEKYADILKLQEKLLQKEISEIEFLNHLIEL